MVTGAVGPREVTGRVQSRVSDNFNLERGKQFDESLLLSVQRSSRTSASLADDRQQRVEGV